jgi:hypothetical protein
MKEKDHLEDPAVDWCVILICIFKKCNGGNGVD